MHDRVPSNEERCMYFRWCWTEYLWWLWPPILLLRFLISFLRVSLTVRPRLGLLPMIFSHDCCPVPPHYLHPTPPNHTTPHNILVSKHNMLHRYYCELEKAETLTVDKHETIMNKNIEDPSLSALLLPSKGRTAPTTTNNNNNTTDNEEITVLEKFLLQLLSEVKVSISAETESGGEMTTHGDQEQKEQELQHCSSDDDLVADQKATVSIVIDNAKLPSQALHQCLLDRLCSQSGVVEGLDQDQKQRRQGRRFSDGCNIIYRPQYGSPTMKESKRETRWSSSSTSGVNHNSKNGQKRDTQPSSSSLGLVRPRRRCSEDFSVEDCNYNGDDGTTRLTAITSSSGCVRVVHDSSSSSFEQPSRANNLFRHKSDQAFMKRVQLEAGGVDHHRSHPLVSPTKQKLSDSSQSRFCSSYSSSSLSTSSSSRNNSSTSNDFSLPPLPVRGEMKIVYSSSPGPGRQFHKSVPV